MPRSDISYTSASNMAFICKDLFNEMTPNFFSYSRVYKDGSRAELWSDQATLEYAFVEKNYISELYTADYYRPDERYALLESKIESFLNGEKNNQKHLHHF